MTKDSGDVHQSICFLTAPHLDTQDKCFRDTTTLSNLFITPFFILKVSKQKSQTLDQGELGDKSGVLKSILDDIMCPIMIGYILYIVGITDTNYLTFSDESH